MSEKLGASAITLQAAATEPRHAAHETNERVRQDADANLVPARGQSIISQQSTEIDQSVIDNAVQFINEKANEFVYSGYEQIGRYLLERFFNNDIILASSRSPRKAGELQ